MNTKKIKHSLPLLGFLLLGFLFLSFFLGGRASAEQGLVVYLSFEAKTFAPPEYLARSRTLPLPGTDLLLSGNVFSLRSGGVLVPLDPKNYVFRWFLGGVKIEDTIGRDEIRYTVPSLSPGSVLRFRLDLVSPVTEERVAGGSIDIPIAQPKILLYEVTDGRPSSISQESFTGTPGAALTVVAKPYFFNAKGLEELGFRWFADGRLVTGEARQPELLTIRLPAAPVTSRFSLRVENLQNPQEQETVEFIVKTR